MRCSRAAEILECAMDVDKKVYRKQYKLLARACHPDKHPGQEAAVCLPW